MGNQETSTGKSSTFKIFAKFASITQNAPVSKWLTKLIRTNMPNSSRTGRKLSRENWQKSKLPKKQNCSGVEKHLSGYMEHSFLSLYFYCSSKTNHRKNADF